MEMEFGKLSTFIVDDEPDACELLKNLLQLIPSVGKVQSANKVSDAIPMIICSAPDVIFLDVEMDGENGFHLIEELGNLNINVGYVFTTGHIRYAVDAIKKDAVDFLVKPVDFEDLKLAVMKVLIRKNNNGHRSSVTANNHPNHLDNKKIKFSARNGFILVDANDIVYVKADCNYSEMFLLNNKKEILSMNIGSVAKQLPEEQFFRIHRSLLINLKYLSKVDRTANTCLLEHAGASTILPIPRNKIKELEEKFL